MAKFFKASKKQQTAGRQVELKIERLDLNGCGVGYHQNRPVFVAGALKGEPVIAELIEQKSKYSRAKLIKVITDSEYRISPRCAHFGICGGCDLQHLAFSQHLDYKQQKVSELFSRNGIKTELPWHEPIHSQPFHYRRKARLGVQYNKNGQATIGFRKKNTNQLTAVKTCAVLDSAISDIFPLLKTVVDELSVNQAIGHIEVIVTDGISLIIRQLKRLSTQDQHVWLAASNKYGWNIIFDDGENLLPLDGDGVLHYLLPDNIEIAFQAKSFIQVNHQVNVGMIELAMNWLSLDEQDLILDLFCGLGNFSLPIAKKVAHVVGVEGVQAMVEQARENAQNNAIDNCQFYQADLNGDWSTQAWTNDKFNKILLDPARAGAYQAIEKLATLSASHVLYVSCDPATLARDSALLLSSGYKIEKIALMEMFSQTKHIETMVLFQR
ncbi:23S rRNA (uracil(1939)-C(5))-methyltransferase RlmD [Colwelliaceae bacterium 6471]